MNTGQKLMKRGIWEIVPGIVISIVLGCAYGPLSAQGLNEASSADVQGPEIPFSLPLDVVDRSGIQAAIKGHDYIRAETLLLEEIKRNPTSSRLLRLLGGLYFLDKRYLDTSIALKKAEALEPLDYDNRFTLAMAYVALNHREWARPELEKLAQSNPRSALYVYWLARLDYDETKYEAAVTKLQKALELDPNYMKAYDNLGLCHEALGHLDEAIKVYQEANRLNRRQQRKSAWPPLNLGTLLTKLGKIDEAESCLKESLSYDPQIPQAHYQLGVVLEKQKSYPEALQELKQATTLDINYPEPYYALGRIYQRLGDTESAELARSTFQKLKSQKSSN